jgi:endonuclease YncB( thermonuclease family)
MLLAALPSFLRVGGAIALTTAARAFGIIIGAFSSPQLATALVPANATMPLQADERTPLRGSHPAQVMRVIDGDTFEARVHVWPGLEITTKVRLRGIDAPEMRARCASEIGKAQAAREALSAILAEGAVGVGQVTLDKYGGRVMADASTRKTADVAAALVRAGMVRGYQGGRREAWC